MKKEQIKQAQKACHGLQRNYHRKVSHVYSKEDGRIIAGFGEDKPAAERFCGRCGDWIPVEGIIEFIVCPKCGTEWDAKLK